MKRTLILIALLCALPWAARAQSPVAPASGTITAQATTCTPPNGSSAACVIFQSNSQLSQIAITVSGTYSATLQFEWSADGGNTYVALTSTPNGGGTAVTSTTSTGVWTAQIGGASFVRVRSSSYTSGVAQVTLNPSQAALAGGQQASSGVISPNTLNAGQNAYYALAGGSLNIAPDPCMTSVAGMITIGGPSPCSGNGGVTAQGSTSNSVIWQCNAAVCTSWTTGSPVQSTSNTGFSMKHLNQIAASNFAGQCTLVSGTCTVTLNLTYTTPLCAAFRVSGTVTGILTGSLSATTLTLSSSVGTDNGVVWGFCMGDPT